MDRCRTEASPVEVVVDWIGLVWRAAMSRSWPTNWHDDECYQALQTHADACPESKNMGAGKQRFALPGI